MNAPETPPESTRNMAKELAAALDWWRVAGVDSDMVDEPTDWLADALPEAATGADATDQSQPALQAAKKTNAEPAKRGFAPATKPQQQIGGDQTNWPSDLAAFQKWWLDEKSLDNGGSSPRVTPRGQAGAELMVVVPHPEQGDTDILLSGPQGKLLLAMLRAMQIAPGDTYLAAALTRHTPLPDWDGLQAGGLGAVLAHHIGLAAPKRLLLLGRRILPLLPHNTAQGSVALREFNHDSANVLSNAPSAAAAGLDTMLAQPGEKARFWRRWLEWTA